MGMPELLLPRPTKTIAGTRSPGTPCIARTIAIAVTGALVQQKYEETQSIAKAVAGALVKQKAQETQLITEAFTRQMEKTHAQYEKLLKETRA